MNWESFVRKNVTIRKIHDDFVKKKAINLSRFLQNRLNELLEEEILNKLTFTEEEDKKLNLVLIKNKEFRIVGHGKTHKEAMDMVRETVKDLVENYLLEEDSKLTKGAIELKNKLAKLILGGGD